MTASIKPWYGPCKKAVMSDVESVEPLATKLKVRNDSPQSQPENEPHMVDFANGSSKVPLHKVLHAYAGLARPGTYYAPSRNLPSMAPAGLVGFGVASVHLGLILAQARGITVPNLSICTAWFCGGVGLLTAGLWEFLLENSHGGAVMACYGLYWWSFAAIYTPSFGVVDSFTRYCTANVDKMPAGLTAEEWILEMLTHAVAFWTMGYAFLSFAVCATLLKSTVMFFLCLLFVFAIFLTITIGYLAPTAAVAVRVAGGFAATAGFFAMYNGLAGILTKENSYIYLKPILLPGPKTVEEDSLNDSF